MRTYLVGRSPYADVVIADPSVAEHHAEIVETSDGRLFITDCASGAGTWRFSGEADHGLWEPIRQRFIERSDIIRLGDYQCVLADLLAPVLPAGSGEGAALRDVRRGLHGRVERDPATGELVRRRL